MFMQLSGDAHTDPVVLSDQLDTTSNLAAQPKHLTDTSCFNGRFGATTGIE